MKEAPKLSTLGCRLNAYESEAMRALAAQAGLSDACPGNIVAMGFPHVPQPGISEAYSGNIMVLSFPEVSQPGI